VGPGRFAPLQLAGVGVSLSVGDGLRMAVLGWQSECALRDRSDLASGFEQRAGLALPDTAEECVELGRSMLRVHLASEAERVAPSPTGVVSGEISPPNPDHVHTIDPDLRIDGCDGCEALNKKWRDEQVAKERARRDRWAENLVAKTRHLQDINRGNAHCAPTDLGLLGAALIADAIDDVERRLDKIEDRLIHMTNAIDEA
jgi:hypothetical protein